MEWAVAGVLGLLGYAVKMLYDIAHEVVALRAEVKQMRIDVDKGLAKSIRQIADVIETHLEIPDEQTFFRSEEKK